MSISFDNLNKTKKLMRDAKSLFSFHDKFSEATKKGNKGNIDKHKKGFNADDRFKSFTANVYFSAYTGTYGSSSVGNFLSLESGELQEALIQYLRDNEEEVIKGMAEIISKKAKSLVSSAKKEIAIAVSAIEGVEEFNVLEYAANAKA